MDYATVVIWLYCVFYGTVFLILSIVSTCKLKDEIMENKLQLQMTNNSVAASIELLTHKDKQSVQQSDQQTNSVPQEKHIAKKRNCFYWFTRWLKLIYQKKKIYLALVPHIFDQATDIGVIFEYNTLRSNDDIQEKINTTYLLYISIFILIIHRIMSSVGIWLITKNFQNVLLQIFDMLMLKAVWTSYVLQRDEPSTTQRFLQILEATFEAMPQLLLSTAFTVKTGTFEPIIIISLCTSLWSLTSRVSTDDKAWLHSTWHSLNFKPNRCPFFNWRYLLRILVRFMEISSRLCLFTLIWINLGGMATAIIIAFEVLYLLITCFIFKSIGMMGNLLYMVIDDGDDVYANLNDAPYVRKFIAFFYVYRTISAYIYLILVTCFANISFETMNVESYANRHSITMDTNSLGLYLFIYAWICYCIWPCLCFGVVIDYGCRNDETYWWNYKSFHNLSTGRSGPALCYYGQYIDMLELVELGKVLERNDWVFLKRIADGVKGNNAEEAPSKHIQQQAKKIVLQFYPNYFDDNNANKADTTLDVIGNDPSEKIVTNLNESDSKSDSKSSDSSETYSVSPDVSDGFDDTLPSIELLVCGYAHKHNVSKNIIGMIVNIYSILYCLNPSTSILCIPPSKYYLNIPWKIGKLYKVTGMDAKCKLYTCVFLRNTLYWFKDKDEYPLSSVKFDEHILRLKIDIKKCQIQVNVSRKKYVFRSCNDDVKEIKDWFSCLENAMKQLP